MQVTRISDGDRDRDYDGLHIGRVYTLEDLGYESASVIPLFAERSPYWNLPNNFGRDGHHYYNSYYYPDAIKAHLSYVTPSENNYGHVLAGLKPHVTNDSEKQWASSFVIYEFEEGEEDPDVVTAPQVSVPVAERERLETVHIFQDKAVSGSTRARPGYLQMRECASSGGFDVLLVDDLSRLSRDDYEMKGLLRAFTWDGLRVVGVTDGYDSDRKGHKIHAGFKGLMNEMFLDDLRERTHRGMTGQAMKGYNCGGRTYGYRNVPIEDETRMDAYGRPSVLAVRYEIDEVQAGIVRKIHAWYASGYSYKWIASELNRLRVRSSRGGTWAVSAVKVILENEMYEGRLIWNRRAWIKHPETGKRVYRERPCEEWIVRANPELRIVSEEVVAAVRTRQHERRQQYLSTVQSSAQRYLFSGLMSCAECDSSFVIVAGGRYGCAAHKNRGPEVCGNGLSVSRHIVEERLLKSIKASLRDPGNLEKFKRSAVEMIESRNATCRVETLQGLLKDAERVRANLLNAIKQGVVTSTTRDAMRDAEVEIDELREEITRAEKWRVPGILPGAVTRYQQAIEQLEERLGDRVEPAREILRSLLGDRVRIHRKGEHLEAEIPNQVRALLAKSLNERVDSGGCGGQI